MQSGRFEELAVFLLSAENVGAMTERASLGSRGLCFDSFTADLIMYWRELRRRGYRPGERFEALVAAERGCLRGEYGTAGADGRA